MPVICLVYIKRMICIGRLDIYPAIDPSDLRLILAGQDIIIITISCKNSA